MASSAEGGVRSQPGRAGRPAGYTAFLPRSARRICSVRRERSLRSLRELKNIGAVVKRARNFVTISGHYFPAPVAEEYRQLQLFKEARA